MDKEARQAHGHNREQTPTTVRNMLRINTIKATCFLMSQSHNSLLHLCSRNRYITRILRGKSHIAHIIDTINNCSKCSFHTPAMLASPDTTSMLQGSGVLQLFINRTSFQNSSGLPCASLLAKASFLSCDSCCLINRSEYLNLALDNFIISHIGPYLGFPASRHIIKHYRAPSFFIMFSQCKSEAF